MFKSKKILSILLLLSIIASCMSMTAFAGRPEKDWQPDNRDVDSNIVQTFETEENFESDIETYEKEVILKTLYNDDAANYFDDIMNSKSRSSFGNAELANIEKLFGCTLDITTAYQILDTETENNYTRFVSKDKTEISLNENMESLGYTATSDSYSTSTMITNVKNYLAALTNEYAFYFTGHGSTTLLGFKQNGWITPSDVTGNWHFVFLDACSTAASTGWANAFKINGYSNRAFLGWNGSIGWSNGYLFTQEFWPLVNGTNTIRQAAVDAAALVPGSGTTPIKFYGDTSYNGKAW